MKTNRISIDQHNVSLNAVLCEVEKVAAYNGLVGKQALHLRLLAEELMGMVPELLEYCGGDFWIECDNNEVDLCVELSALTMSTELRDNLIDISKSKKNSAAQGIMGKIRAVVDYMVYPDETPMYDAFFVKYGLESAVLMDDTWSLANYKNNVGENHNEEAWDELEKSIVSKLADDVTVGVQGRKVKIVVKKKF